MSKGIFVRCSLATSLFVVFFYAAPVLQSCSDGPEPFSDYSSHPDVPLEKFAAGRLGIVQPTFARSYLVVAYRYASGVPLSKDEQFGVFAVWNNRIGEYPIYSTPGEQTSGPPNPYLESISTEAATKIWSDARATVVSTPAPQINPFQGLNDYSGYLNCATDAFTNAADVLGERVKTFGKDQVGVKAWVGAQDLVFANCGGIPDKPAIPPPPESGLPEILLFDREYQIAAAYMYSVHFDEADQAFRHIATEKKSPWHEIAPYLVARNLVRRATLDILNPPASPNRFTPPPVFDPEKMQQAVTYIRTTLSERQHAPYSEQLQALLNRAEFHLHPQQQARYLSEVLNKPAPQGRFFQSLWDYTTLLDLRPDTSHHTYYQPGSSDPEQFAKLTTERQSDDLTDWIVTFQMAEGGTDHALQMWRDHRDSLPWLLAILSKTESNSLFAPEVLSAADRVPPSSPAYTTAFYHRMRLRNATHNYKEVRLSIDALLASTADLPSTAREDLLDLRLDAASDLKDAIPLLARDVGAVRHDRSGISITEDSARLHVLAPHGGVFLETLPINLELAAVQNPKLAKEVQMQIVRNIWVRAILLGRHDVAQSLDPLVQDISSFPGNPPKETIAEWIRQYESPKAPDEKQFAAIFLLQHQRAAGFTMGSEDPWCASPYAFDDDTASHRPPPTVFPESSFLTEAQRKQAAVERASLDNLDSQANYYTKIAIDFALGHPDDPRVPESLSRAVKNTRMNCNNPRTSSLSKKAFDLLHERYATTPWAKNTKYWY